MSVGGAGEARPVAPLGEDEGSPGAAAQAGEAPAEAQVARGSAPGPAGGSVHGDLLRMRFERETAVFAPDPEAVEVPVEGGLKGAWNKAIASGLSSLGDLKLADKAEKELRDLFARQLRERAAGAPPEQIDAIAAALAKELRGASIRGKNLDDLARDVEGFVEDVGAFLAKKLTFTRLEARVKQEVQARGGLNPGEDKVINEQQVKPLAEAIQAHAEKLTVKTDFGGDVKIDFQKIFKEADRAIRQIDGTARIRFERTDFKSEVGARIEVLDPLVKGASVRVTGWAELQAGKFDARIEGKAEVKDLYTDPTLGPAADLSARLRYADPGLGVTATLSGDVKIPLHPGASAAWNAKAGLETRSRDGSFVGRFEAGMAGAGGRWETSYASLGLEKKFGDRVSGTANVRVDATPGGIVSTAAMVGLKVNW